MRMREPLVIKGHLRHTGDGYECSGLEVDGKPLYQYMPGYDLGHMPRQWITSTDSFDAEQNRLSGYEPGTPLTEEERDDMRDGTGRGKDWNYVYTEALFADYGKVKITIEWEAE